MENYSRELLHPAHVVTGRGDAADESGVVNPAARRRRLPRLSIAARVRRLGDGLAALSGARADVLESAPGARARFVALGGGLLSTGGVPRSSWGVARHTRSGRR